MIRFVVISIKCFKFRNFFKLTMLFAENYLSLKLCEAWKLVVEDLRRNEIEPTSEDHLLLCDKMQRINQWKIFLQRTVEFLCKKETQNVNNFFISIIDVSINYIRVCARSMGKTQCRGRGILHFDTK